MLPQASPLRALREWAAAPVPPGFMITEARPKQVISFSDPSDALTFSVPEIDDVRVSNVYVRNTGLFPRPHRRPDRRPCGADEEQISQEGNAASEVRYEVTA